MCESGTTEAIRQCEQLRLYHPLVNKFYKAAGEQVKCQRFDRVFTLTKRNIFAAVRLQPNADSVYLIRNLYVLDTERRQGYGKLLLRYALTQIAPAVAYCFVRYSLQEFYVGLGFTEACTLPPSIARLAEQYNLREKGWCLLMYKPVISA